MYYKDQLKYALVVSFFLTEFHLAVAFQQGHHPVHMQTAGSSHTVLCVSITKAFSFLTLISRLGLSLTKTNLIKTVLLIEIMVK